MDEKQIENTEQTEKNATQEESNKQARDFADSFMEEDEGEGEATQEDSSEDSKEEDRQVPLTALEAEREKRRESDARIRLLEQALSNQGKTNQKDEDYDEDEIIDRKLLSQDRAIMKQEILEESYCDSHPERVQFINENLEDLFRVEPWAKQAVESAKNRWAMGYKLCKKFMGGEPDADSGRGRRSTLEQKKADARRAVDNARKPRSPMSLNNTKEVSKSDYLKSIAGKPEFKAFRRQVRGK